MKQDGFRGQNRGHFLKVSFSFTDLRRYLDNHLIRNRSYLNNWYHLWLASTGRLQTLRSIFQDAARVKNLENLVFLLWNYMNTSFSNRLTFFDSLMMISYVLNNLSWHEMITARTW